jgi:uncharacterized protein
MKHHNVTALPPGDAFRTFSGLTLDFANPAVESICIDDIVIGLSRAPRFAGQTRHAFSVAQHSMLVARLLPDDASPEMVVAALVHDGAEAFMCDVPWPLKRLLPEYKRIEDAVLRVIFRALGLPDSMPLKHPVIEAADRRAGRMEADWLYCDGLIQRDPAGAPQGAASLLVPMSSTTAASFYGARLRTALARMAAVAESNAAGTLSSAS